MRLLLGFAIALVTCSCERPASTPLDLTPEPATPTVEYVWRQEILTPLPVRVRLPARYGAERVVVFYRTWGSSDWAPLELVRRGQTWSGAVSCREVSTVTGDTRYFFVAVDGKGHEVVGSGWPEWPHVVTVVRALEDGPQSLDGLGAPARCNDPADCPPDFPGCPAYAVRRPACRSDDDCSHGGRCAWDGYCDAANTSSELAERGEQTDEQLLAAAVRRAMRSRVATADSAAGR
jgi:hypothetical protein